MKCINYSDVYILIVLLAIISILIYRYLTILKKYLKEITIVSNKVSNGDFTVKLRNEYSGDLGRLSNNFNFMITKINNTIEELEDKNIKLKGILRSISNGIVAVDHEGRILLMNDVAKTIFCYENYHFEGEKIDSIINNEILLETIKHLMPLRESSQREVEDNHDRFYKIKVDPIVVQNEEKVIIGSIINIEDITENVRLEKIRSDFVANVTHELKTPLTSINGFVETLKNNYGMDPDTRNRFLDIIEVESNRLRSLIDDILILSFIEQNKNDHDEEVNLWTTFKEVYDLTVNLAENKDLSYHYEFFPQKIWIKSNKDYIKQIFLNLIDNAIKYTPKHGNIDVFIKEKKEQIEISVKDTGMGIPKEDIPRIFERFYRVDKARSRKIGGTGLGLAIVKHIVISLNGSITVESKLNEGTEFIVTLPK